MVASKQNDEPMPHRRRVTMTVTEAANMLGISRSTAYELVGTGDLPSLRLGRRIVIPNHAIDDLLASATSTSTGRPRTG